MKLKQMFPSSYLAKEDVVGPITLVVKDVVMEDLEFEGKRESKPVLYFTDGETKPLILNRTVAAAITAQYGEDTDGWQGKPVTVYVDNSVMYMGRMVGGLRVRFTVPVASPGPADTGADGLPVPKKGGKK